MKTTKCLLFTSLVLAGLSGSGCATTATVTPDTDIVPRLSPYSGPRARVAIGSFKWGGEQGSSAITINGPDGAVTYSVTQQSSCMSGLSEMLTTALMESQRFQVLEKQDLGALKDEIQMGEDGYIEKETQVVKGEWKGADLTVFAAVTAFEPDAGGGSYGVGGLLPQFLGGVKVGKKKAQMGLQIRMVDSRTRVTLASKGVKGEASSWSLGAGGGTWGAAGVLVGGLSQYEKTPMHKAISMCIAEAVKEIAESTPATYFKYGS